MRAYQEEYLANQRAAYEAAAFLPSQDPETFRALARAAAAAVRDARVRGSALLREHLFPTLDAIHSISQEELEDLEAFAGALAALRPTPDTALCYYIHTALISYARRRGLRDMLIRLLYQAGMDLHNLESPLSASSMKLYQVRMRNYFTECASYFETEYDKIQDPEIRGYIHRAMGNIALSYEGDDAQSSRLKLAAIDRSLRLLNDPDLRAKTPSLPWDLYVYKTHQERTTMLSFLRSGAADADAFAQVLESAQLVEQRQQRDALERGEPLHPRWRYAYLAARYHCGALPLPGLLEGLYSLANTASDQDFGQISLFCHISVPAYYMAYANELKDPRLQGRVAVRQGRLTRRMFRWISHMPADGEAGPLSFSLLQFLTAYMERPGCMDFLHLAENIFAVCQPSLYVRARLVGRIAQELCLWAVQDCPEVFAGLPCLHSGPAAGQEAVLTAFAEEAGFLCDLGSIFFSSLDAPICRGLFSEEEALLRLHAHYGANLLRRRASTAPYADVAQGHHCRYDEKGGYPLSFSPRLSPAYPMICLVSVADALAAIDGECDTRFFPSRPFGPVVEDVLAGSGGRYAPFAAELIRSPQRQALLRASLDGWREEAYRELFSRRARLEE